MDGAANNLFVVLKQTSKLDEKKADGFRKGSSENRASLSMYSKAIFNILEGHKRPAAIDDGQATARAACDADNHDLFSVVLFSVGDSAFLVVRRFEGTTTEDGAGYGQLAWAALCEKFE